MFLQIAGPMWQLPWAPFKDWLLHASCAERNYPRSALLSDFALTGGLLFGLQASCQVAVVLENS